MLAYQREERTTPRAMNCSTTSKIWNYMVELSILHTFDQDALFVLL